jgi:autophagy-related protein 2
LIVAEFFIFIIFLVIIIFFSLQSGDYSQIAHLLPLENMELDLKPIKMTGITGFQRIGEELAKLWAYDISRHQAHRYLAGVQPIRSIVNVGSGVADLVLLPLAHYREHGNLKRGVQRGVSSFVKNVSLESMTAAARLAQGAQSVLEQVDEVIHNAPTPLSHHAQTQLANQRARNANRRNGGNNDSSSSSSSNVRRTSTLSKQLMPLPLLVRDYVRLMSHYLVVFTLLQHKSYLYHVMNTNVLAVV